MLMSEKEWEKLNTDYHSSYQGSDYNPDDPRWKKRLVTQADILVQMERAGILKHDNPWLDWGCGDGKLSELSEERGCKIYNFDRYMTQGIKRYLGENEVRQHRFDLVLSTSVFEHIRSLGTIDEMVSLLSDYGTLAFHTWINETIPPDPTWFHLLPVHCTFFTNRAMNVLFNQWKFDFSVYQIDARLMFFFRETKQTSSSLIKDKIREMPRTILSMGKAVPISYKLFEAKQ